jgi:hypothetical protein
MSESVEGEKEANLNMLRWIRSKNKVVFISSLANAERKTKGMKKGVKKMLRK